MMSDYVEYVKKKLDSVSPSFCLAKWTSVTMHLESGTTHSCHHPPVHLVTPEELEENPTALHNSKFKIKQRKKMIEGSRPAECDYCWKIEDLKTNETSDRFLKSASEWSLPQFDEVTKNPLDTRFKPKYLEVSFSNSCQFKCSYCSSNYSSSWEEEILKFGEYQTNSGMKTARIFKEEENVYVKAFWAWWPELKKSLHTFRITGGEPLLSPSTFKVMEELLASPEPGLCLAINTNLGAPPVLMTKFVNLIEKLISQKAVKKFEVFTSIDTFGIQAEYIRHGLKHDYFWDNIERILQVSESSRINIMCTFNALSIDSFPELLKKLMDLNSKYRNKQRVLPIYIDISYLRYPDYQTVQILPPSYLLKMEKIVDFIQSNLWDGHSENMFFIQDHYLKSKRILEWMKQPLPEAEQNKLKNRFYSFFSQHDQRRGTSFTSTFPDLEDFWQDCKNREMR